MFTQDGWMYGAIFFCCFFENASAMFCFVDFETSHDFPSTWGRVENDWIYILGIYFSFLSINFSFLSALDPIQIGRCNYKKNKKKNCTVIQTWHDSRCENRSWVWCYRGEMCLWGEQEVRGHWLECCIPVIFQVCWVTNIVNDFSHINDRPQDSETQKRKIEKTKFPVWQHVMTELYTEKRYWSCKL